jgi:hypothetical protein
MREEKIRRMAWWAWPRMVRSEVNSVRTLPCSFGLMFGFARILLYSLRRLVTAISFRYETRRARSSVEISPSLAASGVSVCF